MPVSSASWVIPRAFAMVPSACASSEGALRGHDIEVVRNGLLTAQVQPNVELWKAINLDFPSHHITQDCYRDLAALMSAGCPGWFGLTSRHSCAATGGVFNHCHEMDTYCPTQSVNHSLQAPPCFRVRYNFISKSVAFAID